MNLLVILIIVLLVLGVGGSWPGLGLSHSWGYGPSGLLGVLLVVVLVLLLMGRL